MYFIYLASTLLFIWVSISGLTLTGSRYLSDVSIARSISLMLVALILFFFEHLFGLSSLHWMLPITVIFGILMILRNKKEFLTSEFWQSELVFVLAFIYGFFWRYSFPGISPSSEKITDLFFISNYYPGDTLPPLDNWNPPHLFDYYYAFQHYTAALLGRVFNLDIGLCYNLSLALLAALPLTLAWSISGAYIKNTLFRFLLVCTLALGGTGISPILHLTVQSPDEPRTESRAESVRYEHAMENYSRQNIISSVRFIGGELDRRSATDNQTNKSTVKHFASQAAETKPLLVLPSENFGYQYFLGDHHPTVGGFFLLILAFALIVHSERKQETRLSQALLALCIPVMLITNTWTFPLLVILIFCWIAFKLIYREPIDWQALFAGGIIGLFLVYPFLSGFTSNSLPTPIAFVSNDLHTPALRFLQLHWPVLLLIFFGFVNKNHRRLSITLSASWLVLLIISEFIYIDDITGAQYERTNTVMKWWGWIHTGAVVSLGAVCLGSSTRWIRWSTVVVFILINSVALDLTRYWYYSNRNYQGTLNGHGWYTRDDTNRMMFEYLKEAPKGIVLESIASNAYSNTSIYGIFNDKPVLLGWPSHLNTWHGKVPRIWNLKNEIDMFYRGEIEHPINWLTTNGVQYIVFGPHDNDSYFQQINQNINTSYAWHEYNHSGQRHIGLWVKVPAD